MPSILTSCACVFQVAGLICVGVSIWVVANEDSPDILEEKVHIEIPKDSLFTTAYVIIAVGSFMLFVGFCGCCGAIRESAFMLGVVSIERFLSPSLPVCLHAFLVVCLSVCCSSEYYKTKK